jgi:hypothetical protein
MVAFQVYEEKWRQAVVRGLFAAERERSNPKGNEEFCQKWLKPRP